MDLKKKVVAITGGGRGLGRAMALAFAEQGADIAVLDLNAARTGRDLRALPGAGSARQRVSGQCCG